MEANLTPAQRIRARAKEETRKALLEAALAEMVELGGLENPSIEAICKRAGYTRGTFYLYFEDRDHLNEQLLEWVLSNMLEVLFVSASREAAHVGEIITRFNALLAAGEWPTLHGDARAGYLAVMRALQTSEYVRGRHAEMMNGVIQQMADSVRRDQEAALVRGDVDPDNFAVVLVLSAIGAILWDGIEIDYDIQEAGKALCTLLNVPGAAAGEGRSSADGPGGAR